jgi:hypothetical protein
VGLDVMWFVFCVYLFFFVFVFVFPFVCFLVPENAENEGDALLQFTAEFSSR